MTARSNDERSAQHAGSSASHGRQPFAWRDDALPKSVCWIRGPVAAICFGWTGQSGGASSPWSFVRGLSRSPAAGFIEGWLAVKRLWGRLIDGVEDSSLVTFLPVPPQTRAVRMIHRCRPSFAPCSCSRISPVSLTVLSRPPSYGATRLPQESLSHETYNADGGLYGYAT